MSCVCQSGVSKHLSLRKRKGEEETVDGEEKEDKVYSEADMLSLVPVKELSKKEMKSNILLK